MLGIEQYKKMQEYKKLGISKLKVSEILNLSYKTVYNWWDKDESYFYSFQKEHEFMLDNYRQYIIEILKICPQINNTVILRRLKEEFGDIGVPNSTFYRYVKNVRMQTGFIKPERVFKTREVTEPGYEGQVDFGQYVMKTMYGNNVRIYFFCMTLSYSRMKFAYFSIQPFNASMVIKAHNYAFKYFGGRPQVLMYDQDKTMVVSENLGDVIFVKEFEEYIKETGFTIYLCRGYDPSTKGKVEKTVDFVKHLFLDGRIYYGIDRLNADFLEWMDKEGNGLINSNTKKAPREMFKNEATSLIKVYEKRNEDIVVVTSEHDAVLYKNNRYKVPSKLVKESERIRIERYDDDLLFYLASTNELICKHKLVGGEGNIVTLPYEEHEEPSLEEELYGIYKGNEIAIKFLKRLREQKSRYVYPQCRRLIHMRKYYSDDQILEGMNHCVSVDKCKVLELASYLLYKYDEETAKKYIPKQTFRKYKERSLEIKEELDGGCKGN